MSYSISVQHTYDSIELALFNETTNLETITKPKTAASAQIIPCINQLLEQHNLSYTDLSFVGVNQGPGPFTTLRVVIATVNGLAFAQPYVPLVAVNGLEALLYEQYEQYPTVALLNAFNNDVYAGILTQDIVAITCGPIDTILNDIDDTLSDTKKIKFVGNGVSLHYKHIIKLFGSQAYIPSSVPATCSIQQIGMMAIKYWHAQEHITNKISPLYLKEQAFKRWEP